MEIKGTYTFDAPQDLVWDALQDPIVLATVVPTCWGVEKIADDTYSAVLLFKVGSMQGTFKGTIKLSDFHAPESYSIVVEGQSLIGAVKVAGNMKLTAQGQQSLMEYEGKADFWGRIASVGHRVVAMAAESMIAQSFKMLNNYLAKKAARQKN